MIASRLSRTRPKPFVRTWIAAAAVLGLLSLAGCNDGVSVSRPTVESIEIAPANPSVAAGTSVQLVATAIYSDNSHADVTAQVAWSSANGSVATVNAATGQAAGVTPGSAILSASLQGQSANVVLTVTAATLTAIEVSPPSPSLAAGTSQTFKATGVFSDNSTQDMSAEVNWTSSNTAVATISGSGLATALNTGASTITAACALAGVCGSISGSAPLIVTGATLAFIAVTASTPSIALGTSEQLTATGTYTDHSTQNLTNQVSWSSTDSSVATIGANGVAASVAVGTTQVTASLGGIVSSGVPLAVTAAQLASLAVAPANPSLALGTTVNLTATGTYTDHSTQNLTTQVTWASSAGSVAAVSNAAGSNGHVTTLATGHSNLTAALGAITSPADPLTVTAAALTSIQVTTTQASIAVGTTQPFVATGSYSDGTTQTITSQVTWNSDQPSKATISNTAPNNGVASAVATGTADITATLGAIASAPVVLTVVPATTTITASLATLALSVNNTALNVALTGNPRQISITNTGSTPATNIAVSVAPALPAGTTSSTTCNAVLNPGQSCALTLTPGATPSGAPGAVPTPSVLTISGDNTNQVTTSVLVLTYGLQFQSGYVFAIDDTTPNSGGIGGSVAAPSDAGPVIWSATSTGTIDYSSLAAIDELSTPSAPAPAFQFVSGMTNCAGATDGACDSANILTFYAAASPAPSPAAFAAGNCAGTIGGYSDWHLPAICELGAGGPCPAGTQNMQANLVDNGNIGSLAGDHWSSTEASANPTFMAWLQYFGTGGSGQSGFGTKSFALAVRCARAISH